MKFYVIRHGRTVWNEKHITQGWSQNRLSKFGVEQVKLAAESLKDVNFDIIFSSPLMRTMQTTNIINKFHNVKVVRDNRLIEDNKGMFTGKTDKQITQEVWDLYNKNPKLCGLESGEEIFARVQDFLKDLKEKYSDKKVLIVTHDCVVRMIEFCAQNKIWDENKLMKIPRFQNAQFKEIEI